VEKLFAQWQLINFNGCWHPNSHINIEHPVGSDRAKNPIITFVVNLSVAVNISLSDHFINFFVRELFTKVGHHVTKFSSRDEAVSVLFEKHLIITLCSHSPHGDESIAHKMFSMQAGQ